MAENRAVRPMSGWLTFAAVIMFIVGFHNLIYGIAALRDYTVVVTNLGGTGGANVLYADTTFWGWLFIAIGIVEMLVAYGIYIRNQAARWAGVAIATINAIGQLAFMAAFPFWSIVIIAIDILVIYALLTHEPARTSAGYEEPYPSDRAGVGAPAGRGAGVGRHAEHAAARTGSGDATAGYEGGYEGGGQPGRGGTAPGYGEPTGRHGGMADPGTGGAGYGREGGSPPPSG
ncbi:conserved membrane hypothetical protein [Frankia canadensis]|uniref:DUF7144 domain-containing protein n=1 Tax=Frankia canadensis TaxID=1836972 RepID=A0A2I2KZ96_9ACTN|nr:hypothetical protein [Frankia canadensis]SNQ50977.1 conserved membrane hypothetical protein [Frankia canadensis]SOU58267.1 conserved membrane hypothetical protein [Frankia canadensis]